MNTAGRQTEQICFFLFVAGGIIGLAHFMRGVEFGDGFEMVKIAKNLAARGTFANPFYLENTGPTATESPLYPFLLGALMKVSRRSDSLPASIGNIIANALTAAWLPRLSAIFYGDPVPGIAGAALWLAAARLMPSWDANCTVAGLIFFCLFSASSINKERHPVGFGLRTGGMAGLLYLLNAASAAVALPWIVCLLVSRKVQLKQAAAYSSALLAAFLLTVSPWALRNYRELGAPVQRTNLGPTLYASNNSCAEPSLLENRRNGCYEVRHPNSSLSEVRLLERLGEVEYDRRRFADAKNWITAHPARFGQLTLRRFGLFWFPSPEQHLFTIATIWLATALSIHGLILMAYRREPVTLFVMATLLLYPPIYYIVVADVRYRYPVLWLSVMTAGYSLHGIGQGMLRYPWGSWLARMFHDMAAEG